MLQLPDSFSYTPGLSIRCFVILLCFLLVMEFPGDVLAHERKILRVAGWDVYADPEHRDKTIGYRSFEEEAGVDIRFTPLKNLDEIVDIAESGSDFDVFIISNEGIRLLHDMGLVVPLELDKLPHYGNLHPNLRYSDWSLFDSRVYAVPWAWGPTGLLYDADVMDAPDSWAVLWDPQYAGRVALWDDVSMIWTAALAIGYRNVYSLTRDQLARVKDKLLALNGQVLGYYSGEQEELAFLREKGVVAMNSWFDPSARLRNAGRNFGMVIPAEGAVGMFDSYLVSRDTHHRELAYRYINHQISPLVQKEMVLVTGLAPANIETLSLLSAQQIKALHLDELDYFSRMLLWDHMPRKHLYEAVLKEVRDDLARRVAGE